MPKPYLFLKDRHTMLFRPQQDRSTGRLSDAQLAQGKAKKLIQGMGPLKTPENGMLPFAELRELTQQVRGILALQSLTKNGQSLISLPCHYINAAQMEIVQRVAGL
jgi:hypothetical protein